jgi:hypothetical protein
MEVMRDVNDSRMASSQRKTPEPLRTGTVFIPAETQRCLERRATIPVGSFSATPGSDELADRL